MRDADARRRMAGRLGIVLAVVAFPLWLAGPARAELRMTASSGGGTTAAPPSTQAPSLGGWNVSADGNAVDILIDNTTGLAGIHPLSEADFPEAQSQFQTGPFGSSLASLFWPGSAGGNFGSLSAELGIPSQLEPIASQLNDPIKAAAQYPQGPASARYPSGASGGEAVMSAQAAAGGTNAEGAITDEGPAAILHFNSARGISSATAAKTADGQATSAVTDVSILGGIVDIGSVTGTASAVSDGTTGTGSAVTHITGLTVLGQPASLGSDGLVLPSFANALGGLTGPIVQNAISQVISGLGLTVTELPTTQTASGSAFTATSGGVAVTITPPSSAAPLLEQAASVLAPYFPAQAAIIPTLPGILQGLTMTITLGRATASANASAPFNATFTPPPFAAPPAAGAAGGSAPVGAVPTGNSTGATSGVAPATAAIPATGGTAPAIAGTGTGGTVTQPPTSLVALSEPLGVGPVVLGVFATLLAGLGLWRLGRMLLPTDAAPVCPLGEDQ
jgi:hypothetical protein